MLESVEYSILVRPSVSFQFTAESHDHPISCWGCVACFQLGRKDYSKPLYETGLPEGFTAYAPGSSWGEGLGPVKAEEELSDGTPMEGTSMEWMFSDNE